MKNWVEQFRHRLGSVDAVPQLVLVGVFTGILTAMVIFAMKVIVLEYIMTGFSPAILNCPDTKMLHPRRC